MKSRKSDELISRVPLFSGLSKKDLKVVSSLTTRLSLPAGHELMHQGGLGREFVIVLEGTVEVVIDGEIVAECGPGEFFGEIALLEGRPRNASVVAKDDVVVDVIGRGEFSSLLNNRPEIDKKVRAAMAQRLADDAELQG